MPLEADQTGNMTLKQFFLQFGNREFRCPKCRSYMFGSSGVKDSDDRVYHCHGNEKWSCDFEAPSWEEFQKYFVFSVQAELTLEAARLVLGRDDED